MVYNIGVNQLPLNKRTQVLHLMVEGSSMRSISRVVGVSMGSIARLLTQAGAVCEEFHNERVREVRASHVQCDELWSFCYAKARNVACAKAAPDGAGDVWTWTALDSDTKLMLAWLVSPDCGSQYALELMDDLRDRVVDRVQLSTDGHGSYRGAVEEAFGADADYSMVTKVFGSDGVIDQRKTVIQGNPDLTLADTAHVERHNLTTRMSLRRFTRLTNAHSKRIEQHCHAIALGFTYYNFCRWHSTLRQTPAMAAGLAETQYGLSWLVDLIDAKFPPHKGPRGPYKRANLQIGK